MKTAKVTIIFTFLFITSSNVFSSWKPAALNGKNVTALAFSSGKLFVGTEKAGIYCYENHSATRIGIDSLVDATVRCIEVFDRGNIIIAGTDIGLFVYSEKSASSWIKNDQIESLGIQAMLRYHDSLLFVVTDKKVYLSKISGDSMATDLNFEAIDVSNTLPSETRNLQLRCITMFRDTLFIGSIFSESESSWGGILRSNDNGKTWSQFNDGFEMDKPGIQSLVAFLEQFNSKQPSYLADVIIDINTKESAVFRKTGNDAVWERVPALNNKRINELYVTYFSNSKIALEHVATDSGVYKKSNNIWDEIDNLANVNSIVSNDDGLTGDGYTILFAGTTTGLYENGEVVLFKKKQKVRQNQLEKGPDNHSLIISPNKVKGLAAGARVIPDPNSNNPVSLQGKTIK